MTTTPRSVQQLLARRIAFACAGLVTAIALGVLAGWALGNDAWTRLGIGGVAMMPDTALGFFLAALAVAARAAGSQRPARLASNLAAAAVGLLALAEWTEIVSAFFMARGAPFHFHLLPEPAYQLPASPQTALTLLLTALALLLAWRRWGYAGHASEWIAFAIFLANLIGVASVVFGGVELLHLRGYAAVPVAALVAGLALGIAVPLAIWDRHGLTGLLSSHTGGGIMLRRILPAALAIILVVSGLLAHGLQLDWFSAPFGGAILGGISFAVLFALMLRAAMSINRMEAERAETARAALLRETEVQRVNRTLRLLSAANQAMRDANSQIELLDELCRIVIDVGGYRFAFIGYAENDDRKTVTPVASAGFEDGYLNELVVTWDDSPTGQGTVGTAIRSGTPVVVRSIQRDPSMAPCRDILLKRGYASASAFPLRIGGSVQGVVVIYSATEDAFGMEECALLENLAADMGYGIGALRAAESREQAESARRRSESILDRAQQIAHLGSWEWDLFSQNVLWSDQMFRIFGYEPGEVAPSKEAVLARTHADDRERVAESLRALAGGSVSSVDLGHRIVWEDGMVRHVHMQCEVEFRADKPCRIIGSTQDTTVQMRREVELQRTNRALRLLSAFTQATREAST